MRSIDVSVVLAVRNEQRYIESALQSILNQPGVAHEVIVIDDNSTDDTYLILSRMQDMQPDRLIVFRNPGKGKCPAFNFGIGQASGRFVCIFAGDDIMPEGSLAARFSRVMDFSDAAPVVGLCKLITMSDIKRFDGHLIPKLPGKSSLSGVSPLMNRHAVAKIFPVPENLPNEDTWMELAVSYFPGWQVVRSDIVGCAWRVHTGNSINMLDDFSKYNPKITSRMRAIPLFYEMHGAELSQRGRIALRAKITCEANRAAGNMAGVLMSPVGLVDKLRAASTTNRVAYNLRRFFYGLLSGW